MPCYRRTACGADCHNTHRTTTLAQFNPLRITEPGASDNPLIAAPTGEAATELEAWLMQQRAKSNAVNPIWPTSNATGTDRFVNYAGWDKPDYNVGRPTLPPDAVYNALQPAPNTEYGQVLPYGRDTTTGELRWAMPSMARDYLQGQYDLSQGPRTGTVTPEATLALGGSALRTSAQGTTAGSTALRTFGGPGAKNADLDSLKWAQAMDKQGKATRQEIWNQTGWFKDPVSQQWLNEISDDAAKYQAVRHPVTGEDTWQDFTKPHPDTTYDRLVHHPELMAAYPQVSETRISFGKEMPGYGGMLYPPPLPGMPSRMEYPGLDLPRLPLMGHETQHAVQTIEGLPPGGNLTDAFHDDALKPYLIEEKNHIVNELMRPMSWEKYQESRGPGVTPELYEKYVAGKQKPVDWTKPYAQEIWNDAARNVYRRLSGEAQARLTEKRWFMTPEERQARPPWMEYDVPTWRQIVREPRFPRKKAAGSQGSENE